MVRTEGRLTINSACMIGATQPEPTDIEIHRPTPVMTGTKREVGTNLLKRATWNRTARNSFNGGLTHSVCWGGSTVTCAGEQSLIAYRAMENIHPSMREFCIETGAHGMLQLCRAWKAEGQLIEAIAKPSMMGNLTSVASSLAEDVTLEEVPLPNAHSTISTRVKWLPSSAIIGASRSTYLAKSMTEFDHVAVNKETCIGTQHWIIIYHENTTYRTNEKVNDIESKDTRACFICSSVYIASPSAQRLGKAR